MAARSSTAYQPMQQKNPTPQKTIPANIMPRPTLQDILGNVGKTSGGTSLRDSLRRAEQNQTVKPNLDIATKPIVQTKEQVATPVSTPMEPAPTQKTAQVTVKSKKEVFSAKARSVSEDILQTLNKSTTTQINDVDDIVELSRNEMLYERKKVNQTFKQKSLQQRYGPHVTEKPSNNIRTLADYQIERQQQEEGRRLAKLKNQAMHAARIERERLKQMKLLKSQQPEEKVRTLAEYQAEQQALDEFSPRRRSARTAVSRFTPDTDDYSHITSYHHHNKAVKKVKVKPVEIKPKSLVIPIPQHGCISVRSLAQNLGLKMTDITSRLTALGEEDVVAGDGDRLLDGDLAELLLLELGHTADRTATTTTVDELLSPTHQQSNLEGLTKVSRSPTVCIIGHVDHGKTTLLDAIRHSSSSSSSTTSATASPAATAMAGKEAGGITQRLAAFTVPVTNNREVIFVDTPGHFAFSSMRKQASSAADIAILVIALDEGVMPQTIDAARAALNNNCSIVIALSKCDRITSETDRNRIKLRVLTELAEKTGVLSEDLGGSCMSVMISSFTNEGIPSLLELLSLQADVLELTAVQQGCHVEAVVLDCQVSKGRGVTADLLLKQGTLSIGDHIIAGISSGRVKAIYNEHGEAIPHAHPAQPVRVLGLRSLPPVGDELITVSDVSKVKAIVERRERIIEMKQMRMMEEQLRLKAEMEEQTANAAAAAAAAAAEAALKQQQQQQQLAQDHAQAGDSVDADGNTVVNKPVAHAVAVAAVAAAKPAPAIISPGLTLLLKADGLGSLEALRQVVDGTLAGLRSIACEDQRQLPKVIIANAQVGAVTASDIDLVSSTATSTAKQESMVLAFNVNTIDSSVKSIAKERAVELINADVIYRLEDALRVRLNALLPRDRVVEKQGAAIVAKVFKFKDSKNTVVAGLNVTQGRLATAAQLIKEERESSHKTSSSSSSSPNDAAAAVDASVYYRITRNNGSVVIEQTTGHTDLKRFKDAVGMVPFGNECGLSIQGFDSFEEGDTIECFAVYNRLQSLPATGHHVDLMDAVGNAARAAGAKAAKTITGSRSRQSSSSVAAGNSNDQQQLQHADEKMKLQRASSDAGR